MPSLPYFIKGYLIGLAIAAPVGPIGVLCIRRTLTGGRLIGFLSGLGAATADMCFGAIAAFGITALQDLLLRQQEWLRLVGGAFLIYLGARTCFAAPSTEPSIEGPARGRLSAYFSTFGLTLTNPVTILSFMAIFAGLRLGEAAGTSGAALVLVCGVFLGSASWWLVLSALIGVFRGRFMSTWMLWGNRGAGAVLLGFGVAALCIR